MMKTFIIALFLCGTSMSPFICADEKNKQIETRSDDQIDDGDFTLDHEENNLVAQLNEIRAERCKRQALIAKREEEAKQACVPCPEPCCDEPSCCYSTEDAWGNPYRVYTDHVEGRWIGITQGYTSLGVFIAPPMKCSLIPFFDLRGHWFNNGRTAGNLGGGLRYVTSGSTVLGVNAYYDFRYGTWHHRYEQIGVGLEVLRPCWDLRLNGYIPTGSREGRSRLNEFDNFYGSFRATCRQRRSSMGGFDAQAGLWIKQKCPCDLFDLYGAVGFYAFFSEVHKRNAYGGDARLISHLGRYLTLEVRGGYDSVFRGNVQGRIAFTIPFDEIFSPGKNCCWSAKDCCQCAIAYQPVQREEIVILDKKQCCWTWNWDASSRSGCSACD